ncbi:MAG: ROK family protein [Fimbriimonadales bacterium]|nr:ROK family protein [Fimbriimonadales bacterium]
MSASHVVGVDLGGTNVRAAVVDAEGRMLGDPVQASSRGEEGPEATAEAVALCVLEAMNAAKVAVRGVGVAIPGTVDDETGVVRWSPNLGRRIGDVFHYWKDVPFREMLARHLDLPMAMGNDANLAALGEYRFGLGRNSADCLVMFTVGTGIGFGVVLGPRSLQGDVRGPAMLLGGNKGGAEGGHMVILRDGLDTTAGLYGTVEAYCQRDSIVKRAVYRLVRGRRSLLTDLCEGDLSKITPKMLSEAAERGDELSIQVWREVGSFLGLGIANAINLFAPSVVAIGGQIAKAGKWLLEPAIAVARDASIESLWADVRTIQLAECIDEAGVLGGAALALLQSDGVRG